MSKMGSFVKFGFATVVIAVISVTVVETWPVTLSGLTKTELMGIEKLRQRVINDLPPEKEYMKGDVFMLRWLTAKNFDVDKAEQLLRDNFKWRRENNIDQILMEDWSQMKQDYPYQLDQVDKFGRPILYFKFGDWNIRAASVSGMLPKLNKHFARMFEEADQMIWKMREEGSNITQFNLILNMDGFNSVQHGCFSCLPFYATLSRTMEASYPGTAERVLMINTPRTFEIILRLLQGILSKQSRETLKVYGADRKEWEPVLLEFMNPDQLPGDLKLV